MPCRVGSPRCFLQSSFWSSTTMQSNSSWRTVGDGLTSSKKVVEHPLKKRFEVPSQWNEFPLYVSSMLQSASHLPDDLLAQSSFCNLLQLSSAWSRPFSLPWQTFVVAANCFCIRNTQYKESCTSFFLSSPLALSAIFDGVVGIEPCSIFSNSYQPQYPHLATPPWTALVVGLEKSDH